MPVPIGSLRAPSWTLQAPIWTLRALNPERHFKSHFDATGLHFGGRGRHFGATGIILEVLCWCFWDVVWKLLCASVADTGRFNLFDGEHRLT